MNPNTECIEKPCAFPNGCRIAGVCAASLPPIPEKAPDGNTLYNAWRYIKVQWRTALEFDSKKAADLHETMDVLQEAFVRQTK